MKAIADTEYVAARNALIPEAEDFANQAMGRKPMQRLVGEVGHEWNRVFFAKMDELARTKGIA